MPIPLLPVLLMQALLGMVFIVTIIWVKSPITEFVH